MEQYDRDLTLRDARRQFFERCGFDNGGYNDAWVRLQAGPIPVSFPNTTARRRAVVFHDLHHILTGYETTWIGEAEIGAWEIASGCAHHYPAWILNLGALAVGLMIAPRRAYRAFMRGRHTRNLYRASVDDTMLGRTVGAMQQELLLRTPESRITPADRVAWAIWLFIALVVLLFPAAIIITALLFLIR